MRSRESVPLYRPVRLEPVEGKYPACQVLLSIPATAVGKIVNCPCGKKQQAIPPSSLQAQRQPQETVASSLYNTDSTAPVPRLLDNTRTQNSLPTLSPSSTPKLPSTSHAAPQPSTLRKHLTLVAGVFAAFIAVVLLLLSVVHAVSTGNVREAVFHAVVSLFPFSISIACLTERYRTLAFRFIGGVVAIIVTGVLIGSLVNPNAAIGGRALVFLFLTCVGAASLAIKGKWPSS